MKAMKKMLVLLLALCMLTGIFAGTSMAAGPGWVKDGYYWYYQNADGTYKTGWYKEKGVWYYLDPDWDGVMVSADSGYPAGKDIGGKRYYFEKNGALATSTGWRKLTGMAQVGTAWIYVLSGGVMAAGWQKISGKWYYFKTDGLMVQWPIQDGGTWYAMNPFSGEWMTSGKGWYLYENLTWSNTGWVYLNGDGTLKTGWLKNGGKWYYLDPDTAQMVIGAEAIGNYWTWWLFDTSGALVEGIQGWKKVNGQWYYLKSTDGKLKYGWLREKGKWYYLGPHMYCTPGIGYFINDTLYYFNADGTLIE